MDLYLSETKQQNFNRDKELEQRFSRTIKAILGNQFISQNEIEDLQNGTDFLLLKAHQFRIGVRLRRYRHYLHKNRREDFTIRYKRPSGISTEYQKIQKGLVDYILYGFVDEQERRIIQYFIGALDVFRKTEASPIIKPNKPLDSWLAIYRISQFPKEFIVKRWP